MKKIKINTELLRLMDDYNLFMTSAKSIQVPFRITKEKSNHPSSLYEETDLDSDFDFGKITLDCEIRDRNQNNYSFQILTDRFANRVLARLDEGNGTHRNNCDEIPLDQQMVTTPHFHKYDVLGRFIAYKTEVLNKVDITSLSIQEGFKIFCDEENISSSNDAIISIEIQEAGVLPFEHDNDPLNGITF
jgi:hypothetical protein